MHHTKFAEMNVPRKWPGIRNWTFDLLEERENLEIKNGRFGLVSVIEDDEENNVDEQENEKQKLKEVSKIKYILSLLIIQ